MERAYASVIALLMATPSIASDLHGYQVPATYQLYICKRGCAPTDARKAFSMVTVVLSMRPLSDQEPRPPGEGCFAVTNTKRTGSAVQRETVGKTSWTIENGKLKFALSGATDARYLIELEMKDNEVRGVGTSGDETRDQVVGYRSGAPDPANCKPWNPVPAHRKKFIPYSPIDDARALALQHDFERMGVKSIKAADLQKNLYDQHTFQDA